MNEMENLKSNLRLLTGLLNIDHRGYKSPTEAWWQLHDRIVVSNLELFRLLHDSGLALLCDQTVNYMDNYEAGLTE